MRIALIAALAQNRVIGRDQRLPWSLPGDLAHFKALTLGKPLIMGRKTHESIGRPLPGRRNIVLSRSGSAPAGCEGASTPEEALALCQEAPEVMVAGGGEVYALFLPRAQRQYLTLVWEEVPGDTFYPRWEPGEWQEVEREDHPGSPGYSFVTLERLGR